MVETTDLVLPSIRFPRSLPLRPSRSLFSSTFLPFWACARFTCLVGACNFRYLKLASPRLDFYRRQDGVEKWIHLETVWSLVIVAGIIVPPLARRSFGATGVPEQLPPGNRGTRNHDRCEFHAALRRHSPAFLLGRTLTAAASNHETPLVTRATAAGPERLFGQRAGHFNVARAMPSEPRSQRTRTGPPIPGAPPEELVRSVLASGHGSCSGSADPGPATSRARGDFRGLRRRWRHRRPC